MDPPQDGDRPGQDTPSRICAALNTVRQTAVVPWSAAQMYALVNDIGSYPAFLPWCSGAQVLEAGDLELTATLTLSAAGVHESFTTRNRMQPASRIDVQLLDGPFRHLDGSWTFEPQPDGGCRIALCMNFEFKSRLARLALQKPFNHILHSMIDAFIRRAEQLHGKR